MQAQATAALVGEFPFEFREGLLWIRVDISQSSAPLNFLVDSGAGVSVLNLGTAKRLHLKAGNWVTVQGVHTTLRGYRQKGLKAKVEAVSLPEEFLAVDLTQLSNSCERAVDGLLGADFFANRIAQIDFVELKIRLLNALDVKQSDDILPIQPRSGGMRVPIVVNGQKEQWFRLDTGCATALQWVTGSVPDNHRAKQVAIGLSQISIPQTTTQVLLGARRFDGVPTGLHRRVIFQGEAGLLGNGLLSRYSRVTIDAINGRLILQDLKGSE